MDTVDLGPAAQRLADLVARVTDDELGRPTPCPVYTLGDLIDHVGGLALAFTAAANKDIGSTYVNEARPGDASRLGQDWRARIPRDLGTLAQAPGSRQAWASVPRSRGIRVRQSWPSRDASPGRASFTYVLPMSLFAAAVKASARPPT